MNIDAQFNALSQSPSQWQRLKLSEPGGNSQKYTSRSNRILFSISRDETLIIVSQVPQQASDNQRAIIHFSDTDCVISGSQTHGCCVCVGKNNEKTNFHSHSKPKQGFHHVPSKCQCPLCLNKAELNVTISRNWDHLETLFKSFLEWRRHSFPVANIQTERTSLLDGSKLYTQSNLALNTHEKQKIRSLAIKTELERSSMYE